MYINHTRRSLVDELSIIRNFGDGIKVPVNMSSGYSNSVSY